MTREEAKGNLIHALRWNDIPKKEALNMAIKALEQEPCEDCISRHAVLDIVNNPLNIRLGEIIKKLPSVTPQPKNGEEAMIDKVLEIIDWNISQTGNERESISKSARLSNMRWLREKVEALKGGEQE